MIASKHIKQNIARAGSNRMQTAYDISQCSDVPEHACSLTRAFTALAHAHKWAYIWHILSFNAQNRSSMHAVLLRTSLLSHMNKMGVHMANSISQCSEAPVHVCSLIPEP